ncbi:glycosyltransferase family 4 protein [Yersinia sp. IP36721]|uniref:glycosyltransferase family 4 protein n=1 Tax=Yersinia sp. IP36721 TaxID=2161716 RepID=UPI000EAE83BA|nr:glycosyltransferase family 4 protein [Yersinia sp. IP36721]
MRLAIFVDDYLPYSTRVAAKMMHELAIELKRLGHEPIIITPAYKNSESRLYIDTIDEIPVWYFKNGDVKCSSKIRRAFNETLISFNAFFALKGKINEGTYFDGVICYSPSIFFGPIVSYLKRKFNCKSYLILRDLFPQWAIDEGLIREGSLIAKYFIFFEELNYKSANSIGLMSERNLELFNLRHDNKYNTHVMYNWASAKPYKSSSRSDSLREKLSLQEKVIFFYGGNIGRAQDMSNLLLLAKGMKEHSRAHFIFIGQGDEVELVNSKIIEWSLTNVNFLPSVEQSEFRRILSDVDIGLFSLAKSHKTHNFPGKLLGYMVESIPILGSVNPGNDLLDVINNNDAGYVFINGDNKSLLRAAIKLLNDYDDRRFRGKMANKLLINMFSVESAAIKIIDNII